MVSIHYLNFVYFHENIDTSENIVNINYNNVILILLINILNIVKTEI